jgi:hypothetical protein
MAWPRWLRRVLFARETRAVRHAGRIVDPVSRLRFLKAAVPPSPYVDGPGRRHFRQFMLGAGLLLAFLTPFVIKLAAGKPETSHPTAHALQPPSRAAPPTEPTAPAPVWQVERTGDSEVYSNGLRIDTRYTISNRPRFYLAFSHAAGPAGRVPRSQPAGIVYHSTESSLAPFEAQDTPELKRLGESLLEYVRRQRAYHYLIDRFGRVYRVVAESDIAYHAGHSVWAGGQWFYVDLNSSFLGISFEAHTNPAGGGAVNAAQVRAAAMLTEMLRSRYQIPAENCVTHAQVSVNPSNMLLGYHTDWSAGFPFASIGLPDNYQRALPSVWAFGFDFEPAWLHSAGMSPGIELGEQDLARGAAAARMPPAAYRKALRERYGAWLAEVRETRSPAPQFSSGSAGR